MLSRVSARPARSYHTRWQFAACEPLQVAERCVVTNAEALIVDTTALIYSLFDELRAAGREVVSPVFCMNDDTGSDEHIVVHACVHVESPRPDLPQARDRRSAGRRIRSRHARGTL